MQHPVFTTYLTRLYQIGYTWEVSKEWKHVLLNNSTQREVSSWPTEAKKELGDVLTTIQKGHPVGMPDVRKMTSVAKDVFEIRIKDSSGIYRAFYFIETKAGILLFHAFKKKTQATPKKEIEAGRSKLQAFLEEIKND